MLFFREDIPAGHFSIEKAPIESFFVELNLRKNNRIVNISYYKNNVFSHMKVIRRNMNIHSSNYDNFIFFGDFNADVSDKVMPDLKGLIKQPTCFKNPENPSCIDLFLTNRPWRFCSCYVIETGLSDFNIMTVSVMKMHYKKLSQKIIHYRDHKKFSNRNFVNSVKKVSSNKNPNEENGRIDFFLSKCAKVVNKHAPCKRKSTNEAIRDLLRTNISRKRLWRDLN